MNIDSDQMVTINQLADLVMDISGKELLKKHITGPLGVRGKNFDNHLIFEKLGWRPSKPLGNGLEKTYARIARQINKEKSA